MKFDKLKPDLQNLNLAGVKKAASRAARVRVKLSRRQWIAIACAVIVVGLLLALLLRPRPASVTLPVVAEGTYIKKGQTLFVIDPLVYRARVDKAKAQLNKARAQALKAKRDLDRIRPLYQQSAASQLELDNAIASYESAAADVVVGEADLTQAEMTLGYTSSRPSRGISPSATPTSERSWGRMANRCWRRW